MAKEKIKSGSYREITWEAMVLGFLVGVLLNASITYAGLLIGFTIVGSEIAAIIGWGVLRGILRRSTIVENNINQTIASAINNTGAGIIFTIPVLYLRGVDFEFLHVILATMCGATLGVAFIIPVRKQMIDIDRLRFPSGTAVGAILKSPGAGVRKALLLAAGVVFSALVSAAVHSGWIAETVDLGAFLRMPAYFSNVWAISLLSLGAGFISGRAGLAVLIGGILAYWIVTPLAVLFGWVPAGLGAAEAVEFAHSQMNRPLGIGMMIGGALMGIVLTFPSIREAFSSLRRGSAKSSEERSEELSIKYLYLAVIGSIVVLCAVGFVAAKPLGLPRIILIALAGTLWLWLAGIIVAQCTGMTDWSPVSGMALIAVTIILFFAYGADHRSAVLLAVLIGATVCVAMSEGADMMQDLKTGTLVGAIPRRQQAVQLLFAWMGPLITVAVVEVLWRAYGFGPGTSIPAPQAQALDAAISGVIGGNVPADKYLTGALVGGILSATPFGGLGVMVGLSMYLPLLYILPFGLGGVLNILLGKTRGERWVENNGVPIAAGLIVGDAIVGVIFAMIMVLQGLK
ncbi:MAG: oligopeptide transporter, OPT family [Candidatus Glassbacteria bacterium RIFCSPLOWO2_12_FULL_58_11]|uniref:Oligopeptide transporter, OPT family n=1 Tax=Candidatus Glassbacteria bacterium RIFCSPLOWO2_12_FULL_58_11 TaxID=1817867 RepID=A0A1F5YSM3_9BACT|nr:MAG: oligopeptide transporter, OPT family [Candidatus Glassbacteria bacterium RIFCSPLOWO2_12_FULL_58_11]